MAEQNWQASAQTGGLHFGEGNFVDEAIVLAVAAIQSRRARGAELRCSVGQHCCRLQFIADDEAASSLVSFLMDEMVGGKVVSRMEATHLRSDVLTRLSKTLVNMLDANGGKWKMSLEIVPA